MDSDFFLFLNRLVGTTGMQMSLVVILAISIMCAVILFLKKVLYSPAISGPNADKQVGS